MTRDRYDRYDTMSLRTLSQTPLHSTVETRTRYHSFRNIICFYLEQEKYALKATFILKCRIINKFNFDTLYEVYKPKLPQIQFFINLFD